MAKAILAIPLNFHNRTPVPAWHRKHLQYAIDAVNGYTPDKTWQPLSLLAVSLDMHAMGKGDLGGEYAFTNEEREILIQGAAILHDAYMNDRRTNRTADPGYGLTNFVSYDRIFYNQHTNDTHFLQGFIDDNFMCQSASDITYTSYLKPLSDSYSIESLGKEVLSVNAQ